MAFIYYYLGLLASLGEAWSDDMEDTTEKGSSDGGCSEDPVTLRLLLNVQRRRGHTLFPPCPCFAYFHINEV